MDMRTQWGKEGEMNWEMDMYITYVKYIADGNPEYSTGALWCLSLALCEDLDDGLGGTGRSKREGKYVYI